jgi:predicted acyl esterase
MIRAAAASTLAALMWVAPLPAQTLQVTVPATDGTPLATDVYLPFGSGPWPVVLIRTPYDKDGMWEVCIGLALLEYACVAQDTRGRYESGGEDTVFRDDADDGRVTVEWVADQPWCDGHVGMFGGSAFGIPQYLLAPGADPVLRSIAPVVATPDLYHHAFLQGGAIREALAVNWLEGQDAGEFYDEVRSHRLKDPWWDAVEVLERAGSVHAAGLHVGGWYDIFGQGALDGYSTFQQRGGSGAVGRQYLVMGPWTHNDLFSRRAGALTYPASAAVDPLDLLLPWYEATLRDDPSAIDDWPPVRVYLMGAVDEPGAPGNVWIGFDRWPPRASTAELFLTANGRLDVAAPAAGELELVSDPTDPVPTLGGANLFPDLEVDGRPMGDGPQDQRPIEERDDVLVFSTEPLAEPVAVAGPVRCVLWLVPDTSDLDLAVRLTDVYPDGRSMLVLDGVQRARMGCADDRECLLTPGEPVAITVELWSTAIAFNAGHRIRIAVSGSNSPRFEVNPNDGGDLNLPTAPVTATPSLLVGADHPSRLELPVLPSPRRVTARVRPATPVAAAGPGGVPESFLHSLRSAARGGRPASVGRDSSRAEGAKRP